MLTFLQTDVFIFQRKSLKKYPFLKLKNLFVWEKEKLLVILLKRVFMM